MSCAATTERPNVGRVRSCTPAWRDPPCSANHASNAAQRCVSSPSPSGGESPAPTQADAGAIVHFCKKRIEQEERVGGVPG
jgi:hypothetical protein